jgi:hypothetical protein
VENAPDFPANAGKNAEFIRPRMDAQLVVEVPGDKRMYFSSPWGLLRRRVCATNLHN